MTAVRPGFPPGRFPHSDRPRPAAREAARILRAWTGEAAVEHLLLLACGLDSAQLGEHEIAAQLRGAWRIRARRTPADRSSTG